jgi:hypothetical protein
MARKKRTSAALEQSQHRLDGMRSIGEPLDFGAGMNLAEYDAKIQAFQAQLSSYNTMLSGVDEMAAQITLAEQELRSYSEKMLLSVAARYGKDSLQYMQAGGKQRKSTSKRSSSSTASTSPETLTAPSPEKATTNGKATAIAV